MGSATARFLILLTNTTPSPLLLHHHPHRCPPILRLARYRLRHSIPSPFSSLSHLHQYLLPSSLFETKFSTHKHHLHTQAASSHFTTSSSSSFSSPDASSHPWPEWSYFINNLSATTNTTWFFNNTHVDVDEFVSVSNLPKDFLHAASACLAFARNQPNILGMLSRRDIEVVVGNGFPFLFKNSDESARKMKLFLDGSGLHSNMSNTDTARTVDLMRFLLSYASNLVSSENNNLHNRELVESSVRNLLNELAQLSYNAPESNLSGSVHNQFQDRYRQTSRPIGQNIEMKRGDWICPRCNFMNFARNVKCLECEEARPKRQLTGGEWECPQCDFFNYGRNMVCLRCDCKRPGEVSLVTSDSRSGLGYGTGSYANKADVDSRLAANEEKAQRWFSKMSQLDSTSDMSSAIADEDFPEIMPLRKGVNRFVVSTRKTPLERRLANAQYQRNLGNSGTHEGNNLHSMDTSKTLNQTSSQSLDQILAHKSAAAESDSMNNGQNSGINAPSSVSNSASPKYGAPKGSNANYVPFVPLPADMFAKKPENTKMDENEVETDNNKSLASSAGEQMGTGFRNNDNGNSRDSWQSTENPSSRAPSNDREKQEAEKSERWFKRVAELHNVTDLPSAISDEDFPEIMPMRKGENRFVVSKKKDRSLTSTTYKRRMSMEQANNTNFVPFVPFPPDYFAKRDNQQIDGADATNKAMGETSNSATPEKCAEKLEDARNGVPNAAYVQDQQHSTGSWSPRPSGENLNQTKSGAAYGAQMSGNSNQTVTDPQPSVSDSLSSGYFRNENMCETPNLMGNSVQNHANPQASGTASGSSGYFLKETTNKTANLTGTTPQRTENDGIRNNWTGKSLEGSAVKEPDPLDMSEEAKAERWFRRVAQIKDISELSQIPDEDFPSIMPMRKGVNRFVVSKRKTPLERRLTNAQYRRNLPIVSSDPVKESDNS